MESNRAAHFTVRVVRRHCCDNYKCYCVYKLTLTNDVHKTHLFHSCENKGKLSNIAIIVSSYPEYNECICKSHCDHK